MYITDELPNFLAGISNIKKSTNRSSMSHLQCRPIYRPTV